MQLCSIAVRLLSAAIASFLIFGLAGEAIGQQLDTGSITVKVADAISGAPIDNAEVFLISEGTPLSSLTDAKGILNFPNLPPGIYRIEVHHAEYDKADARTFEIRQGERVSVTVKLVLTLKEIGSVRSHSSIVVTSESVNDASAERKLSQTLTDAMNKLAGVTVEDSTFQDSAFNISLRNHDASQTGYAIDGMPISGPAAQSLGTAQDLFSGSTVNFNPTAGFLGGTINFQTLRPTKTWAVNAVGTIGNLGTSIYALSVTGSSGRLAMAFQHSMSAKDSPLSGLVYGDQSGRVFEHIGSAQAHGDLAKLSLALSKRTTLDFAALVANSQNNSICSDYVTVAACGFGSVPTSRSHSSFLSVSGNSLIGNVQTTAYAGASSGTFSYENDARQLNNLAVAPFRSTIGYRTLNFGWQGSITAKRHTDTFGYFGSRTTQSSVQTVSGSPVTVPQPANSSSSLFFNNKIKANDKLAITHGLSIASATGAGPSLVLSENFDWTPAKSDAYQGSVSVGSAQPPFGVSNPLTEALSADYDCYNHSTFVSGPQDGAVRQSSISYNASWRHQFKTGSFTLSLYRQNSYGQSFFAAVPIGAEPNSVFPNGLASYLADLARVWSTPSICGSIPFDPTNVYVTQSISGIGQVNQGYSLTGRVSLGKAVSLFPSYSVGSTYLSSIDPRLESPGSFYAAGAQLPRRPLRTANLLADGVLTKSHAEWLASAQFTDVNNGNNLPAYTVYSAGIVFHARYGSTLTIVESNIFGTHTGLFTSYLGIEPRPTVGGGSLAYSTIPLPPRQWAVTWRIPWLQKVAPSPSPH